MKLATFIALLGIASTSILYGAMASIIYVQFPNQQDRLLQQRGWALAKNLRHQIEPMILTDDRLGINEAITSARLSDQDIEYAFILDVDKKPLASTFPRGVPKSLIDLVGQNSKEKKINSFVVDGHSRLNVSMPLMAGELGSIHLGINRDPVLAYMKSSLTKLTIAFLVLTIVGISTAILIGQAVARPLNQVTGTLKQSPGKWPKLEHVKAGPTLEVQEFVSIFKQMISDLEQAEQSRQTYERKLLAAERLASTGQLAAEIAHEINNPLDGMTAVARHLDKIADDPQRVRKYVKLIKQGLERIGKTGRQLLNLSRKDVTDYKEVFNVRNTIENTIALLNGSMKKRGIAIRVVCKERYRAIGNAVAIGQVLMNLLLNAADAERDKGGQIDLSVTSNNEDILIAVTDDGHGISEEVSKRVFEAFFTTKAAEGGIGLGLSVSQNLVQKCGGKLILAERKTENGGAKFVIKLNSYNKKEYDNVL